MTEETVESGALYSMKTFETSSFAQSGSFESHLSPACDMTRKCMLLRSVPECECHKVHLFTEGV